MTTKPGRLTFSSYALISSSHATAGGVVADEIDHDVGVEKQHNLPLSLFCPLPQLPHELDAITDIRTVFPNTDER
jgi:hypothetical protein